MAYPSTWMTNGYTSTRRSDASLGSQMHRNARGISIDTYFAEEDKLVLIGRSDARRTGDILPKTERRIVRPDGEVRVIDTLA